MTRPTMQFLLPILAFVLLQAQPLCRALSLSSFSRFHGSRLEQRQNEPQHPKSGASTWTMRKQKASDRRTRRMQRGAEDLAQGLIRENLQQTITSSPMDLSNWGGKQKMIQPIKEKTGGRGRSRKRATLYHSLSSYHNTFLGLLTEEYKAEVRVCLSRSISFEV
jgi:hypothetical protein